MFFLLLLQSAAVLFFPALDGGGEIDVILRTASASIFGYLLGGGLSGEEGGAPLELPSPEAQSPALPAEAGFALQPPAPEELPTALAGEEPALPADAGSTSTGPSLGEGCGRFRVLAAAGIGLFCLLALLLLRDWPGKAAWAANSPGGSAIVVQFRDYISGSLGCLIGCSSRGGASAP